jgi:hypothetical protein
MTVYTFLNFPDWGLPLSKPRFVVRDGVLAALNLPPLAPEAIFSKASVFDLPLLEHDPGFNPTDWEPWFLDFSYAARLLRSRFPRWPAHRPTVSTEAYLAVNAALLQGFVESARRGGAHPVVVLLPSRAHLAEAGRTVSIGERVLQSARLPYTDMAPCLTALAPGDRFIAGGNHYSPIANAAVAKCLAPVIRAALSNKR